MIDEFYLHFDYCDGIFIFFMGLVHVALMQINNECKAS